MPSSSPTASDSRTGRHLPSAPAVLISAVLFAVAPALIHSTAIDSNPFHFNLVYIVSLAIFLILVLLATKKHYFDGSDHTISLRGKGLSLWLSYLQLSKSNSDKKSRRVVLVSPQLNQPAIWMKSPLMVMLISSVNFGIFAWAAHLVETAVVSTIYELWPAFVVYGILRHNRKDQLYRNPEDGDKVKESKASGEQIVLTALAALGLLFMLGSQIDAISSPLDLFTFNSTIGMIMALIASALGALSVLSSFQLGEAVFYRLVDHPKHGRPDKTNPGERSKQDRLLLLWLTLFGLAVGRLTSVPVLLVAGFSLEGWNILDRGSGMNALAVLGAIVLGWTSASAMVLLRVGNIGSDNPAVNALYFLSPGMALGLLMVLGISLPRFDLFIVGAALIIAINILIQLKPDQQRDSLALGKENLPGSRFGFTAFILSIWMFGTVVYLRDEVLPGDWLKWPAGDYWGLIALSATVFALILGFRMARLTTRISHEDEMMINLFRDCEYLSRRGVLRPDIVTKLATLDTVGTKELLSSYNDLRQMIRSAIDKAQDRDDEQSLVSVSGQLDRLAHSKQQGRDIVELLSLTAFAAVTVGLGLLARPVALDASDTSWSGFLSEVFILLFVSTVAFLCVNLFDIRRERETPLLVKVKQLDDYGVFFRYKRDLAVQQFVAVVISVAMSVAFCVLLYGKWL